MKKLLTIIFILIASLAYGFDIERSLNTVTGNATNTGILAANSVLNGTFASDVSWTKGTGWTITGDVAVATATTGNLNETSSTVVAGKYYALGFDCVVTTGTFRVTAGGWTSDTVSVTGSGMLRYFYATTTGAVTFDGVTAFTGTIDNVTLQEVASTSMFDNIAFGVTETRQPLVFKRTLNRATGNQVAYHFAYETNKATSGDDTGLLIDMLDTASPGTSLPLDIKVGGVTNFNVNATGNVSAAGKFTAGTCDYGASYLTPGSSTAEYDFIQYGNRTTAVPVWGFITSYALTGGTGINQNFLALKPIYNQTSTAGGIDFLINRTETAVGSGEQKLASFGKGGASYVEYTGITNLGIHTNFIGANVASATTIAATGPMFHVTGITTIETITVPLGCTAGCRITIIPDGVFLTGVTGNIALASTSIVSKALTMVYDAGTSKWYPSY